VSETNKKEDAYSQAVASGKYNRENGLHGKYDNVRVFWEDEVTRLFMRPQVEALLKRRAQENKGIHILDLGCGSGDGYELLTHIRQSDAGCSQDDIYLVPEARLSRYKGIEINQDLLNQNSQRWGRNSAMEFVYGDFSAGLPVSEGELPYDIYLTSYGAMSHLDEDQTVRLFADIVRHADDGSILIGDWLGRYSYEWQLLWDGETGKEQWMDYYISYIYPPDQRDKARLSPLKLRLLNRDEVLRIVERVESETGANLEVKELCDRSIFVGRHMDTNDYNPHLNPLRRAVNSLLERNVRTNLHELLISYHSQPDFPQVNKFFERFHSCWNFLVYHTIGLCKAYERGDTAGVPDSGDSPLPDRLKTAARHITNLFRHAEKSRLEDWRSDVIEPQLAYTLRDLEMSLQTGEGNAHGLMGVFMVKK